MNYTQHARLALSLAGGVLLLAACGGDSHTEVPVTDPPVAGTDVPLSATTSAAGALAYIKSLVASTDNTATPVSVGDVVLATSETDEPDPSI